LRRSVDLGKKVPGKLHLPAAAFGREKARFELTPPLAGEVSFDVRIHKIILDDAQAPRHFLVGDAQFIDTLDVLFWQALEEVSHQFVVAVTCFV
jgi:hypothetical protein